MYMCKLQLPKSINPGDSSFFICSFNFFKSFRFTFGPSIDSRTIFAMSKALTPSWTESSKCWWMVCPKNLEFQYLSSTLLFFLFYNRRQMSILDACATSFSDSSNDTTNQTASMTWFFQNVLNIRSNSVIYYIL